MAKPTAAGDQVAPLLQPPPPATYYGVPAVAFEEPPSAAAYVLLPVYPRRRRRRDCACCRSLLSSSTLISLVVLLAALVAAAFILFPSDPDLTVSRLSLDRLRVFPPPLASIDVSLGVKLRVRNPDFFALDYRFIDVSIAYRGRPLGSARTTGGGGHVRARGVTYVDAELRLDGIRVLNDAFYLIEDLARKALPLDTVTEIEGHLRLFFFNIPVKGRISCAVTVNPETQKIVRQDCYPQ